MVCEISCRPTAGGLALRLTWNALPLGTLTPPAGEAAVSAMRGAEITPAGWVVTAPAGELEYTLALPVLAACPGPLHGSALAVLEGEAFIGARSAILPGFPADTDLMWKADGWQVDDYAGLVLGGPGITHLARGRGNAATMLHLLPDVAAAPDDLAATLTSTTGRWAAFRMSAPALPVSVLVTGTSARLALTPPGWAEVSTSWRPLQVSHALMHAAGLLARPAGITAWWAHEGIAEYAARVEAARLAPERDAELRTWLAAAYREHGQLAIPPADLQGDRLPVVGALLVHVLSKRILAITGNSRSLFHLIDELNRSYTGNRGYTNEDLVTVLFSLTGRDFAPFFASHVTGREPLPPEPFAALEKS